MREEGARNETCASPAGRDEARDETDAATASATAARSGTAPAPTEDEIFAKMTLDELNAKSVLADVFFGFDSAELDERRAPSCRRTPSG